MCMNYTNNIVQAQVKEKQKKLLAIVKEVHSFCVKYNINYSLCGGSLLGAIRHKGFIPWDDDMDIALERKEYEKFVEHFYKQSNLEIVQDIWVPRIVNKDDFSDNKAFVDIFIFDNVPDNAFFAKMKVFCLKILQGMLKYNIDYSRYGLKEKLLVAGTKIIGKVFSFNFKCHMYSIVSQWGNKHGTVALNTYNDLYKLLEIRYPKDIIKQYHKTKFEDTELYIMNGYNEYLTLQYGDYMTLPPEENRYPSHTF